jgi:diamine N-acetyltransferase
VREWHGRGVSRPLMDAAIAEARARGGQRIWLGVWEENPRAIAFYRKCGFIEVGTQDFRLGNDLQRDRVMSMEL